PSTVNDSARAMMAAASNERFTVRLQQSLAIVAAFMFCPICRRRSVSLSQHPFAIEDDVTVCQVRVRRVCNVGVKRGRAGGRVMVRWDRQYIMCAGAAVVAGLLSVSIADAQSVPDATPLSYSAAQIFAEALRDQKTLRDQTAAPDESEWSDFSALADAQWRRSSRGVAQRRPQPLPAVDGFKRHNGGSTGGGKSTPD